MAKCAKCGREYDLKTNVLMYDKKQVFVNACETVFDNGTYKCELQRFCADCTKSYIEWLEEGRNIEK